MADEAFALSPLSARASLPSEADYDAIRDAFMETTRGRWFLTQYAARNRNADTTMVLDAVARIEADIAARAPATPSPAELIAAIRPLIAEARSAADAAMIVPETGDKVAAGRRVARIIREISWSLRETGTDPRICNILDAQLQALEQLHDHVASDTRHEMIGEVFDDLVLRVEEIASAGAPATQRTQTQPKSEPVEAIGANADIAVNAAVVPAAMEAPAADDETERAPTASESAADDAMLDLVAIEMAAADTDLGQSIEDDYDRDDSAIAELKSLANETNALFPTMTDDIETPLSAAPPLQSSLGAALLAGGIVRPQRSSSDAFAAFRRMSQVEKIAFFS